MTLNIDPASLTTMQRLGLMRRAEAEIARNPRNVQAIVSLAGLYVAEKQHAAARDWLTKALALRKKDPEILRLMVSVLNELNELPEARKFARKAAEIEPRNPRNHKNMGLILEHLGQPLKAIEHYLKAHRLEPGSAQTMHDIGRCHGLSGNHAEAQAWYEQALKADPHYALALYSWATGRKFAEGEVEPFLAAASAATSTQAVLADPAMHANLHYAMGKALDDAKRFDEAFDHFARANALRRPEGERDDQLTFLTSMDAFSAPFLSSRRGYGHETARPIFILGLPRSGTTLTESLAGAHSAVTAGDEQTAMSDLARELGRDAPTEGGYRSTVERMSPERVREVAQSYLDAVKPVSGDTPHFTDKLPHNFVNIGLIAFLFPNAKIIHCRRHPLDNCFSLYSNSMSRFHNRYKTDLTRLGIYYRQYAQIMDHWRRVLPGRIHEVFYEDLVANTELNARAMIDYLGLPWEDGVLDRTGSQRSVRTLSMWQVRQPVYQTSKGKWKAYEKQLAPLIEAIGPLVGAYEAELAALGATEQKK